jgi:hypothetical protein
MMRYPATNAIVVATLRCRLRRHRSNSSTTGETAGNIIATIITTHMARKSGSEAAQPLTSIKVCGMRIEDESMSMEPMSIESIGLRARIPRAIPSTGIHTR